MNNRLPFLLISSLLVACDSGAADTQVQARLDALEAQLAALNSTVLSQDARLLQCETVGSSERASLKASIDGLASLEALVPFLTVQGDDIIIEGANLHLRNGEGATDTTDGTGNLVLGYNEEPGGGDVDRSGSHNIINGPGHAYSSYGGYVGGWQAVISAPYAVVLTGTRGAATGREAVVISGDTNEAQGWGAVVATGRSNLASGGKSLVGTGDRNVVSGSLSSVLVGLLETVEGTLAVRVGNEAGPTAP